MPLPNGSGGYQITSGNRGEPVLGAYAAPQTATTTATLTAAQITGGMLVASPGAAAATYTLPTGTLLDAAVPNATVGSTIDLNVVNLGTTAGTVTFAAGTGVTDGGNGLTAVAITSSALFRFRRTADATWLVYKVA
jgi:hypothetical protein